MEHCTALQFVALKQRLCLLSCCRAALARAVLPARNRPWSIIAAALPLSAWAGVVLREMRALERAAQCYQAALQLQPNFVQALNNLAVMHTMQASLSCQGLMHSSTLMPVSNVACTGKGEGGHAASAGSCRGSTQLCGGLEQSGRAAARHGPGACVPPHDSSDARKVIIYTT